MEKQCECCLSPDDLLELTEDHTRMILSCFSVELSTNCSFDNSLNRICGLCIEKIYDSSTFRSQILDSQTKLKKIYSESISSESIEVSTKLKSHIKEEILSDYDDDNDSDDSTLEKNHISSKGNSNDQINQESKTKDNSLSVKDSTPPNENSNVQTQNVDLVEDSILEKCSTSIPNLKRKRDLQSDLTMINKTDDTGRLSNADYSRERLLTHPKKSQIENYSYPSSSDSDKKDAVQKTTQKRIFVQVRFFLNPQRADEFIEKECTWAYSYSHSTEEGMKKFYRCNKKIISNSVQCPASICLLFSKSSRHLVLYRSVQKHNHNVKNEPTLSTVTMEDLKKLHDLHLKPKFMLCNSTQKKNSKNLPNLSQKTQTLNMDELESWLKSNSQVPEDEHKVYVAAYEVFKNDINPNFRFMLTTKRLLSLPSKSDVLHCDATNKIRWRGYSLLIIGSTDKNKTFHPYGMTVTSSELARDFVFLFESLKNAVSSLYSHEMICKVLVCDSTIKMKNAFRQVFGHDATVLMCWALTNQKIQAYIQKNILSTFQKGLIEDLEALQCASTPDVFDRASEKFLDKWKQQKHFSTYFKCEWLMRNSSWYLGATPGTPPTNEALASFRKSISDKHVFNWEQSLEELLNLISGIVGNWSLEYFVDCDKEFAQLPTVSTEMWTEGYKWAKRPLNVYTPEYTNELNLCFKVPDNALMCESRKDLWETFDEYKVQHFSAWDVKLPMDQADWLNGVCECPTYMRDFVCKHLLGLAIFLQYLEPPLDVKKMLGIEESLKK